MTTTMTRPAAPSATATPRRDSGSTAGTLLAAVEALGPRIAAVRDEMERDRRLPASLVQEMAAAGLFRLLVPRGLGGLEVEPPTMLAIVEAAAAMDASVGWVLATNNIGGLCTAWLGEVDGRALAGPGAAGVRVAGALLPRGRAVPVPGGYRVDGRWPYVSGVGHCLWMAFGCVVAAAAGDGSGPPGGRPEMRVVFLPAAAGEVVETRDVLGLRGTGSHDVVVSDVFVPAERTFTLSQPFAHPGRLYSFPYRGLGAAGLASVCLGVARGAIEALGVQATATGSTLAERPAVQRQVAEAEALLGAAGAWLGQTVDEAWQTVNSGRDATPRQQARLRLAATHAATSAAQAVDLMYAAGGGGAVYTGNPLERAFRDVHTATHHFGVQPWTYEEVGRLLLGLAPSPAGALL